MAQTICAVVVTYFPDGDFLQRIEKVALQVAKIVIVDNGSSPPCVEQLTRVAESLSAHLILNPCNQGLASGLNTGVRWAALQGFQWALTLDQDTTVAPDMIETLTTLVDCYSGRGQLAVVGSNYRDKVNGALFHEPVTAVNGFPGKEMTSVLTSGSLISIPAFQAIGGFRDDFFIDCVDHEYCLRARSHGFHVVLASKPIMDHGIGHGAQRRLLWKTVATSNHSPVRQYFLARNSLILAREYWGKESPWIRFYLWAWMKLLVRVVLLEQERLSKIKHVLMGCVDGILGRTGSLSTLEAKLRQL
jgi:rhamnosyltransferase